MRWAWMLIVLAGCSLERPVLVVRVDHSLERHETTLTASVEVK